jgi:hypothetical protein
VEVVGEPESRHRTHLEDTMSTYIDPATALTLARTARDAEIQAAEQYHRSRTARPTRPDEPRHPRWRFARPRPAVAV